MNWGILRMLCSLGFSNKFFRFYSSELIESLKEEDLHEFLAAPDWEFSLFWLATQPDKPRGLINLNTPSESLD